LVVHAKARKRTRVSASEFRDRFKHCAEMAKGERWLVENRRRGQDKYLVDEEWFDRLV